VINHLPQLQIFTLGGLRVVWGGREVPARLWKRKRAAEILRALVEAQNFRVYGQRIEAKLWPDSEREASRTNLRGKIFDLRAILAKSAPPHVDTQAYPPILYEAGILSINPVYRPWVDAQAFESAAFEALDHVAKRHMDAIQSCSRALALWTGEYFDGEGDDGGLMATRYSGMRRELVIKLAEVLGTTPRAERELETCFNDYPWDELLADTLVRYLVESELRSRAHEIFQRHEAALLGRSGEPSKQLAALVGEGDRLSTASRAGTSRLVGREFELQVAETALSALATSQNTRLEIFGSRGSGKTRLLDEISDISQRMGFIPVLAKAYRGCTAEAIAQQFLHGMWRFRIRTEDDVPENQGSWASLLHFAKRISKNAPLVILIDDADFLDEETSRRINEALYEAGGKHIIVRTQHWSRRHSGRDAFSINLRPLNSEESKTVVDDLFNGVATERLKNEIRDLWPGELSVLVSSAHHVQVTGAALLEDGRWILRPEVGSGELLSLETRASLLRRINELGKDEITVLEGITVAGIHPAIDVLAGLLRIEIERVHISLHNLENADLILRSGEVVQVSTAVRVVVAEALEPARRRSLSERASRLRSESAEQRQGLRGRA
jgi:DNA-binding SARP family transcriptional activator